MIAKIIATAVFAFTYLPFLAAADDLEIEFYQTYSRYNDEFKKTVYVVQNVNVLEGVDGFGGSDIYFDCTPGDSGRFMYRIWEFGGFKSGTTDIKVTFDEMNSLIIPIELNPGSQTVYAVFTDKVVEAQKFRQFIGYLQTAKTVKFETTYRDVNYSHAFTTDDGELGRLISDALKKCQIQ
ncbi:hypothetical protein [Bartonella sp. HY406]|uniref:hypothetical protein n=1 Tax=Bartonella sp. HY406 TaxID=2979331 RepID=UPI0021C64533|nr:hypothetical protein [Bartonella sp. HY406]UXN05063.1 hypothetical protein N6B01_14690 [Bartonella sp. HY406]